MLGTLRFILALLVVMNHLWLPTANKVGAHAVLGFYVISGFLMTRILCETYVGPGGSMRYLANRFMRIFPAYWLIAALTLAGLVIFPEYFGNIHGAIKLPQSGYEWLQNITLFDLIEAPLRLVPPAWSLSVEWVFYVLIGVGVSRRSEWAIVWWLVSAVYTIYLVFTGASFGDRYTPPVAASLFFSTGAVIYHSVKSFPSPLPREGSQRLWWLQLGLFCIFPLVVEVFGWDLHMTGFYGAFVLFLLLFVQTTQIAPSGRWREFDRLLGDLAYPVFLSHYLAAGMVNLFSGNGLAQHGLMHFFISLALCLLLSMGIIRYLDPVVNRIRYRIRPTKQQLNSSQ